MLPIRLIPTLRSFRRPFPRPTYRFGIVLLASIASGCSIPAVWIEETQTLTVAADKIKSVAVETHNGDIQIDAKPEALTITAVITARYAGWTKKSAEACRDATVIVSATDEAGRHLFRAHQPGRRRAGWQADISYRVTVPARLAADLSSHNGDITVAGLEGPCEVSTHNGDVSLTARSASLHVDSFNGDIHATAPAEDVRIESHNGDIHMDAAGAKHVGGTINSFNGDITAKLSESASTILSCRTFNGSVHSTLPWNVTEMNREGMTGKLNDGEGRLELESHNGDISLMK